MFSQRDNPSHAAPLNKGQARMGEAGNGHNIMLYLIAINCPYRQQRRRPPVKSMVASYHDIKIITSPMKIHHIMK